MLCCTYYVSIGSLLSTQEELNPLQNAIEFVKDGITALKSQIRRLKNDETASSNQLTMKLQGILDAAVSGGLKNYEVCMYVCMYIQYICILYTGHAIHAQYYIAGNIGWEFIWANWQFSK